MVQRVQSIYMFLVVVFMSFMIMFPLAVFEHLDGSILKYFAFGLKKYTAEGNEVILSSIPVLFLVLTIMILNLVNIFLYAKRTRQMRICVYNILLMVGLIFLVLFYYRHINNNVPVTSHSFKVAIIIPIVSIFFNLLALRGIGADEMLVRSYERLRK